MKRILLALSLVAVLLLVGCSAAVSKITYVGDQTIPKLTEGFGLYGGTVEFKGVYPGWSGTVPLTIVNGQDRDRLFVISVRTSTKAKEGYEPLPPQYFYWITISQPEVTMLKGEVHQVPISLSMPKNSTFTNKKVEVRILVEDTTQTGLVQVAAECKWFIITAD